MKATLHRYNFATIIGVIQSMLRRCGATRRPDPGQLFLYIQAVYSDQLNAELAGRPRLQWPSCHLEMFPLQIAQQGCY